MPGLRRPDAHRRDIPPWPATQIPRATERSGRMTRCPSLCPKPSPICPAFRDNAGLRQASPNTAKSPRAQRQTAPRTNPHHIIGSLWATPIAAVAPAGHRQPRAFPIGSTQHPAASSLGGFPTRADIRSQPQPSRRGPHRKTFTKADIQSERSYPAKSWDNGSVVLGPTRLHPPFTPQ